MQPKALGSARPSYGFGQDGAHSGKLAVIHQLFGALWCGHRRLSELAVAVCALENRQQGGSARAANREGRMLQLNRADLRILVTARQNVQVWTRPDGSSVAQETSRFYGLTRFSTAFTQARPYTIS
jgi:hypothetical protein